MKRTLFMLMSAIAILSLLPGGSHAGNPYFLIERLSLGDDEREGSGNAYRPQASENGRYVSFDSYAPNLVPGDANGTVDVFVRDTLLKTTRLVSVNPIGNEGNSWSHRSAITDDGRFIVFSSDATNFDITDTNGMQDIYMVDRINGVMLLISSSRFGGSANSWSDSPDISPGGEFVVFTSLANDIVPGDTNADVDCFIYEVATGAITRITDASGAEMAGCTQVKISGGVPMVVFETAAAVIPTDTNNQHDVYMVTVTNSNHTRISVSSGTSEPDGISWNPSISRDGRYVAFESLASNLIANDTNTVYDIFVYDTLSGNTSRVSVDSAGQETDDHSWNPHISQNGRYIVFASDATTLVPGDKNGVRDIFVHDTQTARTQRLSTDLLGSEGTDSSDYPTLSGNGEFAFYSSDAPNLVPNDLNGMADIFRVNLRPIQPTPTPVK